MICFKLLFKCCNQDGIEEDLENNRTIKNQLRAPASMSPRNDSSLPQIFEDAINSLQVQNIPDEEVRLAKRLKLEILDSQTLQIGSIIIINAQGMEGSRRNRRDGQTFIGGVEMDGDNYLNDFVIPQEEHGIGRNQLVIRYDMAQKDYFIRDLGQGTGTFIKINDRIALRRGNIISFGDSHMVVTNISNAEQEQISLKFLEGPKVDQDFVFSAQESPIDIGRSVECRLRFFESSLSRHQCKIWYEEGTWYLTDGNGSANSTNGTWLFVDEFFKIIENLVFKAGQTLMKANFIESE